MESQEELQLLAEVRKQFVKELCDPMYEVLAAGQEYLLGLTEEFGTPQQQQQRMAAYLEFRRIKDAWVETTRNKFRALLKSPADTSRKATDVPTLKLELQDSFIVERKIHTSRITMYFQDAIANELSDIRLRLRNYLHNGEFAPREPLDPKVLSEQWVQAWEEVGGATIVWEMVYKAMSDAYLPNLIKAYKQVNAVLEEAGMKAEIGLHTVRMRAYSYTPPHQQHSPAPPTPEYIPPQEYFSRLPPTLNLPPQQPQPPMPQADAWRQSFGHSPATPPHIPDFPQLTPLPEINPGPASGFPSSGFPASGFPASGFPSSLPAIPMPPIPQPVQAKPSLAQKAQLIRNEATAAAARAKTPSGSMNGADSAFMNFFASTTAQDSGAPRAMPSPNAGSAQHASPGGIATPSTSSPAVLQEKPNSHKLMGQLVNMLKQKVGFSSEPSPAQAAGSSVGAAGNESPGRGEGTEMAQQSALSTVVEFSTRMPIPADATPAQAVGLLRERTASLKRKAATQTEKATIEIVALMFQSILTEERIPSAVRVLFARLQMPVIRVALAEPDFFDMLEHPARKLIDRMGSCVLGLESDAVNDDALVVEIRRIVQTIEQYPDTGRRVFKLVLDEFEKFLQKHLGNSETSRKVMGVAQQLELRETLAIQYTIEIRNLIRDVSINEKVREFLLKTWSEVLAVAAVKHGKNGAQTKFYKEGTSRLIWAAGAKHLRADRMKLIAEMPSLMQLLRNGLESINMEGQAAKELVDMLSRALGDTFKVRTQAIDAAQLAAISERLQNLEEFFSNEDLGDLPIRPEDLELMLDMDSQGLVIILQSPIEPSEAAKHWTKEIELGKWFGLEHQGAKATVQYVWHSDMRQLHLLASSDGSSFLIQAHALAGYLETQKLVPMEDEALSVRATRVALDKINASPDQLLN